MRMALQGIVSSFCYRLLLCVLVYCSSSAHAENSDWSSQGIIYLLGPTLDGTSGIGPFDTEVDMDAGDVFDALDGAFLGMYRGQNNRWGVALDVVHMDLKGNATGDRGALSGTVSVRQSSVITSGYYRVAALALDPIWSWCSASALPMASTTGPVSLWVAVTSTLTMKTGRERIASSLT